MSTLCSLLFLLNGAAFAGNNPFSEPDESEFFRLDQQLVTVAARYAQDVRHAPSIVTVIEHKEIRARGYRSLSDLLRELPGVYMWKNKEGRDLAAFRGVLSADNNKILVMVDGVPWYDGVYTHGWTGDYLPVHHIKQVEVIKGPGSAIYGTNAFAGVINVVTFSGADLEGIRFRVVGGSYGRIDTSVNAGSRIQLGMHSLDINGYVRYFQQSGDGVETTPSGSRNLRGDDPKRAMNIGVSASVAGFQAQMHHVDYKHTYLAASVDDLFDLQEADLDQFGLMYHNTFLDFRYRQEIGRSLVVTPGVWLQRHKNPGLYANMDAETGDDEIVDSFESEIIETTKDTARYGAQVEVEARPALGHVLVGGVGFERMRVLSLYDTSFSGFSKEGVRSDFRAPSGASLANVYGFVQHTWSIVPELEVTGGLRVDKRIVTDSSQDGTARGFKLALSPRVGLMFNPLPIFSTKILYGRAFRAPSVREALVQTQIPEGEDEYPFANGSLNVGPEQIDTIEVELSTHHSKIVNGRIVGSYSTLIQEIDKVTPPNEYVNLAGGLNIIGVEVEAEASLSWVELMAGYTFTHAQYRKTADSQNVYSGRSQYEFPPHMVNASVGVAPKDWFFCRLALELYGKRPRADWNGETGLDDGPAFALLHFSGRVAELGPDDRIELTAGVRNVLNSSYGVGVYRDEAGLMKGDQPRYPVPIEGEGRAVYVGIEVAM